MSKDQVLEAIAKMSVMDVVELVKAMEEKFGVTAAAPMAMMAAAPAASGAAAEVQSAFNVVLTNAGGNKISVIKVVRELTGLGLKEAKDLVDGAPKTVKEGVKKEEADSIKAKLVEAGATVDVK